MRTLAALIPATLMALVSAYADDAQIQRTLRDQEVQRHARESQEESTTARNVQPQVAPAPEFDRKEDLLRSVEKARKAYPALRTKDSALSNQLRDAVSQLDGPFVLQPDWYYKIARIVANANGIEAQPVSN